MKLIKKIIILIGVLSSINNIKAQENMYFVAGMPDSDFTPLSFKEIFISDVLKLEHNNLKPVISISDSLHMLRFLRHYPDNNLITAFISEKEYKTQPFATKSHSVIKFNTSDLSMTKMVLDPVKEEGGFLYSLDTDYFKLCEIEGVTTLLYKYSNFNDDSDKIPFTFLYLDKEKLEKTNFSVINYIIPNGTAAGPFFGNNSDKQMLQGDKERNVLLIPSYLQSDSIYRQEIPKEVSVDSYYSAIVVIDNERIRLMYYYYQDSSVRNFHLYNKKQKKLYRIPYEEHYFNVVNYGEWLAGSSRIKYIDEGYEGGFVGSERWIEKNSKYSLSVEKIIERYMKRTEFSGKLAIRNIYDPLLYIEWDTKQTDSEILLIKNDIVYYRKHDEIYKVPIIDKKKLGQHKLVIKNDIVSAIHFMFLTEK